MSCFFFALAGIVGAVGAGVLVFAIVELRRDGD